MIVIRLVATAALVVLAVFAVTFVWNTYFQAPWTRDAFVRADVIQVAPRVSGQVQTVAVADNQVVAKGDVILRIDPKDFELAVKQAEAMVAQAQAGFDTAQQQAQRDNTLLRSGSSAIAVVTLTNAKLAAQAAQAEVQAAMVALDLAKVSLERTTVIAPTDAYVTNLLVDEGDFATAGKPILALVDRTSFRVDAFFMETKLPSIPIGATARIRLMANGQVLTGKVVGISRAVYDNQITSEALLQNPTNSFEWIRLAQRIPVRFALDSAPDSIPLVAGQSATVILDSAVGSGPAWSRAMGRWFDGFL